ncbi:MAG: hypothetical protein ACE5G0_03660 [Rhodothermales bacterium]
MLRVLPKRWFSWDFTIYDGDVSVADLDLAVFKEAGTLHIGGIACTMYREGLMSGAFVLEAEGYVLVRAEKPSALIRMFEVTYDDKRYMLKARAAFFRAFELLEGEQRIGVLSPDHAFTRKMTADLPEAMPLAVRVFIIWLVLILWKRDANAAG